MAWSFELLLKGHGPVGPLQVKMMCVMATTLWGWSAER